MSRREVGTACRVMQSIGAQKFDDLIGDNTDNLHRFTCWLYCLPAEMQHSDEQRRQQPKPVCHAPSCLASMTRAQCTECLHLPWNP